jgi:outer membrane lipoprotein-sorting protein
LKKILLLFWVSFLVSPGWVHAQGDATRYLDSLERKYATLKDYTADVHVHFDLEGFKAPDMQARLYFKIPDKIKIESKKIFFLPKEGSYFNPFMFKKEDFEIKLLEYLTYSGRQAVKLKLTPKKPKRDIRDFVLTLDTDRNLIREMDISSFEGREVKATIEYGQFRDFELPTRIELHLDISFNESREIKDFGQPAEKPKRVTGNVEITYSNYKVNSGLRDEMFKETEPPVWRGGP